MTRHRPDVGEEVELVVDDDGTTRVMVVRAYDPEYGWLLSEALGRDPAWRWRQDPVLRDEHGDYRPLQEGRS